MSYNSLKKQFFDYLNECHTGSEILGIKDLENLPSRDLLLLCGRVDNSLLPYFVQTLKSSSKDIFQKLMGDHEPENRTLVESFFKNYSKTILSNEAVHSQFNPLLYYLPRETFTDPGFVQSRQLFFERQTCDVINEYFLDIFGEDTRFISGEQNAAWNYLWEKLLAKNQGLRK